MTFKASEVPGVITLSEDSMFLEDVVVIGYGTVKKNDMTGSVTAIKTDEINRGAVVSTQDMLKGKVPGLLITPGDGGPGSGSTIRIRGAASLNASNDPLIVIDGVPIAREGGYGMSNPLDMINPNDIESFTVLKDASSAAIYGSRASNGVILITTKKGKTSRPQISYNGSVSVQHNAKRLPVMSPDEYRGFIKDTFGIYYEGDQIQGDITSPIGSVIAKHLSPDTNVDYHDIIFRTAITHDHNVSVAGNVKDVMPYRASIGYTGQQGTLQGSSYDKGTVDLSLAPSFLKKHLTLSVNAKGVYTYSKYADGSVVGNAAFFNPTRDPYFRNEDGSIDYSTCNGYFNYGTGRGESFIPNTLIGVSPMSQLYDRESYGTSRRFIGSASLDYKVHGLESLRFNVTASTDISDYNNKNGSVVGSYQAWSDTENRGIGQYSKEWQLRRSSAIEAYANYNETWGIHNLDVMAGYSWQHFYGSNRTISYFNITDEAKLSEGETLDARYPQWKWESYLVSFYGRINYSIASKYLFTASIRTDGSSKFSPATRWGIFPSGAFAWNIKEENFLKHNRNVSQLKLRLSAGMTGQQDGIGDYAHLARYGLSTDVYKQYLMGAEGYQFMWTPSAYDPNIKWETTTTYNVGIDLGFLNDRITASVDAYLRDTKDLLNQIMTPMGSNFGNSVLTNVGSLRNKGIEFAVNFIPVQTKDWNLSIGFNGTFQNTVFTKLNSTDDANYYINTSGISHGTGSYVGRHQVGYAPYSYWVFQQLYDSEGMPVQNAFVDRNGDGVINSDDKYCAGDPNPDFYYGVNLKLSYKNWDFGFNGHGSAGYAVFNDFASDHSTAYFDINSGNLPNFANAVKATGFKEISGDNQFVSDLYLENASFFRMDDINLGYTFKNISKWEGSIRIAASCQNVFVITKYSGMDPEINSTDGVDKTFWPRPRTYSLRLNINF
ncbi:MAG: SusC/RagA family TonB-linked outer membrane protein [Candidatus Cryptobacteroides sp.]